MTGRLLAGRYRLEERIAAGGMGTVWRARDELLGRAVAVKLLRDSLAEDPVVAERFRREATTAASLSHPNMANVFDYVEDDGRAGIVMELVEAETLAERIARSGALPVDEAARIVAGVLAALQAAHDAGIVHRDVKPANIMLAGPGVKVTDFGIARAAGDATLTRTGTVMGTAHYAAPEQVRGQPATPASDVYAAGVVLYEALTGRRPFEGDSPVAVAVARLTDDPAPPRAHRPEIPEALERVVTIALAREPADRFPSALAMREALERAAPDALEGPPTAAAWPGGEDETIVREPTAPLPPWERAPVRRRRAPGAGRRRAAVAIALALLAAALGLIVALAGRATTVAVPALKGTSIEQARALADRAGLEVAERTRANEAPAGTVLAQSLPAGLKIERGATVTLTVSSGVPPCCEVPSLEGLTLGDAEAALRTAGLVLGEVRVARVEDVPQGTVIEQDPGAGATLPRGAEVDVVLSERREEDEGRGKGRKGRGDD